MLAKEFNHKLILLLTLVVLVSFSFSVAATSLWEDTSDSMYKDRQELEVGDLVTVNIEEDASAVQSAGSSASKDGDVSVEQGTGLLSFINPFSFGYSGSDTADGTTERSGTLEADITVTIEDVTDNGNFLIAGEKDIKINDETQKIVLSGTVRPEDIRADNTIDSRLIANPQIEYEGEGIVGDKQDRGILTRVFNFIF